MQVWAVLWPASQRRPVTEETISLCLAPCAAPSSSPPSPTWWDASCSAGSRQTCSAPSWWESRALRVYHTLGSVNPLTQFSSSRAALRLWWLRECWKYISNSSSTSSRPTDTSWITQCPRDERTALWRMTTKTVAMNEDDALEEINKCTVV